MHPGEIKTRTIFVTLHRTERKPREMRDVGGKVGLVRSEKEAE